MISLHHDYTHKVRGTYIHQRWLSAFLKTSLFRSTFCTSEKLWKKHVLTLRIWNDLSQISCLQSPSCLHELLKTLLFHRSSPDIIFRVFHIILFMLWHCSAETDMGWVHPWVRLGWTELSWVAFCSTCDGRVGMTHRILNQQISIWTLWRLHNTSRLIYMQPVWYFIM